MLSEISILYFLFKNLHAKQTNEIDKCLDWDLKGKVLVMKGGIRSELGLVLTITLQLTSNQAHS